MANKTVNQLATISGLSVNDLVPIFDISENGPEKLKKCTVQELITDKIEEGNSSVEVIDVGTGAINMNIDGNNICTISGSEMKIEAAGTLEVVEKLVIPTNEPTSLENGCIWIA